MAARGALSRVAMVYEIPHAQRVALTKKIPEDESNVKLETLREHIPELDRFAEDHPRVFEHAVRMQGSIGAQSEHAAGVVISGQPLDELMPVMKKSAKDDYLVTAFGETADKPTISKLGFLKLDLLVVVELAKQAYAEELVRRVHGVELDLDRLPALEDPYAVDPAVLDIFARGAVRGIFQWDGKSNMASLTKRLQPAHVHHLAACNAVVRPGVSVHAESYVARRHGEHFDYWDAAVEPALKETYGLPIFQEQIMAVFELLGGYSRPRPTTCAGSCPRTTAPRRARRSATWSCTATASSPPRRRICGQAMAGQIWDFCGHAAEYCFNRIHAEEYALMAVQGAHIKAHYPDAFYASLLTFPPAWVKKPENRSEFYERIVREARSFGIDVRPPDVNLSDQSFTIEGDAVRFGLTGIKGLGPAMVADVLNNRPFASLEDMGARLTACNAAGRHALAQAGALDRFDARANLTLGRARDTRRIASASRSRARTSWRRSARGCAR
jgi:DNA polymerase-3 subunit alpha